MNSTEKFILIPLVKNKAIDKYLERSKQLSLARFIILFSIVLFCINSTNAQTMKSQEMSNNTELATFGAGCFWCVEAIFSRVDGVLDVQSGYSGGQVKNPTYKEVCTGRTGHAEVCQLTYDPSKISYLKLLEIFWKTHNPTTLNRQGNDSGTQYRSAIFYHNEKQMKIATEMKDRINREGIWSDPIVTEIVLFETFYPAEDYHNDYYEKNSNQSYCSFVITPKIEKFEKAFQDYLK